MKRDKIYKTMAAVGCCCMLFFSSSMAHAQEYKWSLSDVLRLGMEKNPGIQAKKANAEMAKSDHNIARMGNIPEISASADAQRNFVISSTPIPAKMFDPTAKQDEIFAAKFGTKYSAGAGVSLNYNLFSPDNLGNTKIAKYKKEIAEVEFAQSKETLKNSLILDYAAVIIAQLQMNLCVEDTLSSYANCNYAENRLKLGEASEDDFLSAQQEMNLSRIRLQDAKAIYSKAKYKLLIDMGVASDVKINTFDLTDDLEMLMHQTEKMSISSPMNLQNDIDNLQINIGKVEKTRATLSFLPTLSITGYYGGNFYGKSFDIMSRKDWYGQTYLGLKISLPISKYAENVFQIKKSRQNLAFAQYQSADHLNQRMQKMNDAHTDMMKFRTELEIRKTNRDIARHRLEIVKAQMELGQTYPAKVQEGQKNCLQSEVDYWQAIYNYLIAIANYNLASNN